MEKPVAPSGAPLSPAGDPLAHDKPRRRLEGHTRLALVDLIPGRGNEVVLFNDSGLSEIIVDASEAPLEDGAVGAYATADGIDVTGFRYLRFRHGLVLFYEAGTTVRVDTPRRGIADCA